MCCCDKPNINGELGYKWQPNHVPSIRPVSAPAVSECDSILYDEPGRCGGTDAHCHHYRVVKSLSSVWLFVRHGAGDEKVRLSRQDNLLPILSTLDTHARYWLLHTLYYAYHGGRDKGSQDERAYWKQAAYEKRIKLRKRHGQTRIEVLPRITQETA